MLPITNYLIVNPMIAMGLIILVLLCIYNVFRRQVRVAMGAWMLILVVLFYVHTQTRSGADGPDDFDPELPENAMEELAQP